MAIIKNPLTVVQQGSAPLANYGSIVYDNNGVDTTLTLATEADFLALTYGGAGAEIGINGVRVNKEKIKEVTVADGVDFLPNNFCYACNYIHTVTLPSSIKNIGTNVFAYCAITSSLTLTNVVSIGDVFLASNTSFNQPIALPNIVSIGNSFLQGCKSFNSTLTLSNNTNFIGANFLYGCTSFAQSLTVPGGLMKIGSDYNPKGSFMYNCTSFTGPLVCNGPSDPTSFVTSGTDANRMLATNDANAVMYTTGVTLTGTYAQNWKDTFADRTATPYRKLILGS